MTPAGTRRASKRPRSTHPVSVTSAWAPRRCHVCPGLPLKSTCACSKRRGIVPNHESQCTADSTGFTVLLTESAMRDAFSPPSDDIMQSTTQDTATAEARSADFSHLQCSPENLQEEMRREVEPPDAFSNARDRSLMQAIPNLEIPIDPVLLVVEESHGQQHLTANSSLQVPEATRLENEDDVSQRLEKIRRLKTGERAVKYGLVDGVMRGNMVYRIPRQNENRRPISDASSATTRYNRELPLIIARAERLALETDSYVLILAQQATGSSASVHFASERMRRDAIDQCATLVNDFQSLMTQLVVAKRSTTLALAQNLEASEKARADVEERLLERDNAVASAEAELAASHNANQALLAELEALRNSLSCSPQRPT